MIRCRARTAPGKDMHSVQGPARAAALLGAGTTRQSPPEGVQGNIWGVKPLARPQGLGLFSALVLLGARNPSLRWSPIFWGA